MTAFSTMHSFLAMGGYGFYVWTAYGITWVLLIIQNKMSRRRLRKRLNDLRGRY